MAGYRVLHYNKNLPEKARKKARQKVKTGNFCEPFTESFYKTVKTMRKITTSKKFNLIKLVEVFLTPVLTWELFEFF